MYVLRRTCEPEFLNVVADLLDPPKRRRGGQSHWPRQWYEIGTRYEELRDDDRTYEQSVKILADEFARGRRTIERVVQFYTSAKEESDRIAREG